MATISLAIRKFTQQDGRKKTTAKRLCVTNVTGLQRITCMFCYDLHLTLTFSGLHKNICLRKVKFGGKFFETKLLSRLSHKAGRLLFSPVLLRKFTIA